jgi:hypothetical protein
MSNLNEGQLGTAAGAAKPPYDSDAVAYYVSQKSSLPLPAMTSEPGCGFAGCEICYPTRPLLNAFRVSAEQAQKESYIQQERAVRNARAAELLAKHPEFDDFLELLSIVPVKFIKS